ncbi:MAG: thioredoxin family protein [Candidatus Dependentiae bacterium]|nr:thioredoxin family protein [Candidatus Dependentiae bacterium]
MNINQSLLYMSALCLSFVGLTAVATPKATDTAHASVMVMSMIGERAELQRYISEHENVVILLYGEHCPPCERFRPVFARVAASGQFAGTVTFLEVSAVQYSAVRRMFGVTKWPTLIFLKNGREVRRSIRRDDLSFISEAKFIEYVNELVAAA